MSQCFWCSVTSCTFVHAEMDKHLYEAELVYCVCMYEMVVGVSLYHTHTHSLSLFINLSLSLSLSLSPSLSLTQQRECGKGQ